MEAKKQIEVSVVPLTLGMILVILFSIIPSATCFSQTPPSATISGSANVCQNDPTPTVIFTGLNGSIRLIAGVN